MLAHFQQALADLVASPDRCIALRAASDPAPLLAEYDLTTREIGRLAAMARHQGMATNCTIYRSNRLTPLVINLPETCRALGAELRPSVDRFWAECPTEYFVHFLIESARFADFLDASVADPAFPEDVAVAVRPVLAREGAVIRARLATTLTPANV